MRGRAAPRRARIVGAWMDAHRREVFTALYAVAEDAAISADADGGSRRPAVGDPGVDARALGCRDLRLSRAVHRRRRGAVRGPDRRADAWRRP